MRHPDTGLSYLFWLISFAGVAGLHRFYLGKPVSGLVYLVTWGVFGVGTILDGIRMPALVRRARLERRIEQLLDHDGDADGDADANGAVRTFVPSTGLRRSRRPRRPGVEHTILTHAMERHGLVTPSRVALAAEIPPEKAREHLERLVVQGFANPVVSRDGAMIYVFPEFLDDQGRRELNTIAG